MSKAPKMIRRDRRAPITAPAIAPPPGVEFRLGVSVVNDIGVSNVVLVEVVIFRLSCDAVVIEGSDKYKVYCKGITAEIVDSVLVLSTTDGSVPLDDTTTDLIGRSVRVSGASGIVVSSGVARTVRRTVGPGGSVSTEAMMNTDTIVIFPFRGAGASSS